MCRWQDRHVCPSASFRVKICTTENTWRICLVYRGDVLLASVTDGMGRFDGALNVHVTEVLTSWYLSRSVTLCWAAAGRLVLNHSHSVKRFWCVASASPSCFGCAPILSAEKALLTQLISSPTASLRCDGALNAVLTKFLTDVGPCSRIHFMRQPAPFIPVVKALNVGVTEFLAKLVLYSRIHAMLQPRAVIAADSVVRAAGAPSRTASHQRLQESCSLLHWRCIPHLHPSRGTFVQRCL